MSFTTPTITHTFQGPPGTASSGYVEFSLLGWMTNGAVTLVPPMTQQFELDSSGDISISTVPSNLDAATEPAAPWNSSYRVDIKLTGSQLGQAESFVVVVPPIQTETNGTTTNGSNIIQLSSLTAQWWMIGQSITGTGIPSNTIVTGATYYSGNYPQQEKANQITISNNATASGTGVSLILGATIDLAYLLPTIQQPL